MDVKMLHREIVETNPGYEIWFERVQMPMIVAAPMGDTTEAEVAEEVAELESHSGEIVEQLMAYAPDGGYIGTPEDAATLCHERGIRPERATPEHRVCSVGFCEVDKKWYGWSHRAIFGFEVGSTVERGDCGYMPTDREDFRQDMIRFWTEDAHEDVMGEFATEGGNPGVNITWRYANTVPNPKLRGTITAVFQLFPSKWGRGEWTAATMVDARQMAVDFARGVS